MISARCPYCHDILENGEIAAAHWIIWTKKARWYTTMFGGSPIKISPYRTAHINGKRCVKCRKIIVEY
jgi:hypothetical protein